MSWLALLIFTFCQNAQGEYRVYKLKITDTKNGKSREIASTLMPQQFVVYNPISSHERVEMIDHWMCWQRSDGEKPLCTRPFAGLEKGPKTESTPLPRP